MRRTIKKRLLCFSLCAMALGTGFAQSVNIDQIIRDSSNNYYSIVQKAEAFFAANGTVGTGYKEYKRWQAMVRNNILPDGKLPDMVKNNQEALDKFNASQKLKITPQATASNWIPLGQPNPSYPAGYAQNGVGRASSLDFVGNNIWISTAGGGMWLGTFVIGNTYFWNPKTDGIPNLAVQDIEIAPTNTNIMYALTGAVGSASGYRSTGVIKSTDGGNSWQLTGLNFSESGSTKGYKLLVHPGNSNIVWACTDAGLYRTADGGTTWNLVTYYTTVGGTQTNLSTNAYDIVYQPGSTTTMYATSNGPYFYKSTDGGVTFLRVDRVGAGLPTSGGRIQIGVTAANSSYIYLLYGNGTSYQGLYRSTNSGTSFSLRSSAPNVLGSQAWRNIAIAVSPTDVDDVYVGGLDVYKSTTGGATGGWTQISDWFTTAANQFCHADIFELKCDGTYLWAATDGGVYRMTRSTDSWVSLNNSMQTGQVYRMGIDPTASAAFVTVGLQDNGTYRNTGAQYLSIGGGDGMETIVTPSNTNVIYMSSQNGNFSRSDDGGNTNTGIRNGAGNWTTPAVLRPGFDTHIYIGYTNIDYNTTSGNGAWSTITTGFASAIESLEFAPSNNSILYATDGASVRRFNLAAGVWSAATIITGNLPAAMTNITELAVDPNNSAHIAISIGGYNATRKVYETYNANAASPTWSSIEGVLPNVPINCITIDDDASNTIYVGTDIGVFVRNDVLQNWVMYSTKLPTTRVYDLEINRSISPNRLYAATFGRGVFYTEVYTGCGASITLSGNVSGLNYTEMSTTVTSTQVLTGGVGTSVAYNAGNKVQLNPGFSAKSDAKFQAYIQGCTGGGNTPRPLEKYLLEDNSTTQQPVQSYINPEGEDELQRDAAAASSLMPARLMPNKGSATKPAAMLKKPASGAAIPPKKINPQGTDQ